MHVIGTAGHVDHGKSTLIAALTGTHPDRLKEEQEREMTIDLGFGWLTLPDGEELGIVDVPGHRDFIENMLAGVGGIDAVLLVIAADEGVMPQTREHLAIIDLLQIPSGLIVLTKIDLAQDPDWLALVESDIAALKAGTVLRDAPILRVSARTGEGLDDLLDSLTKLLQTQPGRRDLGRPRLPIDRVFSMSGFGTVITGTLSDGSLSVADEVELLPSGLRGRVRGLQTHKKQEEHALPGSRTAVNISGVAAENISRGQVVVRPGQYQAARRLDARFRLLRDSSASLKHGTEVKFYLGAAETIGVVRLLGTEELLPGEDGWIQIELRAPVVAVRGDRYILRRPSPGETLGGGSVVDPLPSGRHKRFDEGVLRSLESLSQGSPTQILMEAAQAAGAALIPEVVRRSHLEKEAAASALHELLEAGSLILLEEGKAAVDSDLLLCSAADWRSMQEKAAVLISGYHRAFPLRRGIPREELKSRLRLPQRVFNAVIRKLVDGNEVIQAATALALPEHTVRFDKDQQAKVQALIRRFTASPYAPPTTRECEAEAGQEVLAALIDQGEFVPVSQDILFRKTDYDEMVGKVRTALEQHERITLAETRDLFGTSRKYAQALLEHLDATGMTARDGDYRRLRA